MKMDAATEKKYLAWKKRKILKRMLFLSACILALVSGIILGANRCNRYNDYHATDAPTENTLSTLSNDRDQPVVNHTTEPSDTGETREPIVYCGAANPEDATIISDERAHSYLTLVNRCYRVSNEFSPHDLSTVNVPGVNFRWQTPNVHELRETAARALEALFNEANDVHDLSLLLSSAYRSYEDQVFFHNQAINNAGGNVEEARRWSAVPGHSEHQLGLGADLTTPALEGLGWLHNDFSTTPEGVWVRENAHRFGFIVSFPYGREADVAIIYEPWHIRYVGVETATFIFTQGLILEEYLWYHH